VLGLALGVAWVRRQRRSSDPMIDVRLFRSRAFSIALGVNLITFFVMVGDFLFFGQYLQLVVGLTPLQAALWSLPSAAGFVVSSQLAPRILAGVRPGRVVAGGLFIAVAGLLVLTTVAGSAGPTRLVVASALIALGIGPVVGLITELVVSTAPPEKAGAASGISETAAELGAALGIAVLGSLAMAVYRAGLPVDAPAAARDTLGGAISVAAQLPGAGGPALADAARASFVAGVQITSGVAAAIAAVIAVVAAVTLRAHAAQTASAEDQPAAPEPAEPYAPAYAC